MNKKRLIGIVVFFTLVITNSFGQTPAGNNQEVQFNNNGSFGASSALKWDGTNLKFLDKGSYSSKLYFLSESGDNSYIFSENYGTNQNRLVFHTRNDGDPDYAVFRNFHYSLGEKDVFEIHRTYTLANSNFYVTNGNLGIGKTSINAKLEIAGGSNAWNELTQGTNVGSIHLDPENTGAHFGSALTFGSSDTNNGNNAQAGIYVRSDGSYGTKMYFSTTNSYATGSKTAMMIDHNAKIGIGTSNPQEFLHIEKSENTFIRLTNTATNGSTVKFGPVSSNGKVETQLQYEKELGFYDSSAPAWRLKILENGNVGIGTKTPSSKLDVLGGIKASFDNNRSIMMHTNGDGNSYINYQGGASGSRLGFQINGSSKMSIMKDGKVGIGITSPSYQLDINGSLRTSSWVRVKGTKGIFFEEFGGGIHMIDNTWVRVYNEKSFYHQKGTMRTDGQFHVGKNGERFTVLPNGNVGIGTISPQSKLSVDGEITAKKVKVIASLTVPDYVFEEDYELRTLRETKNYIKENKHLPEIPSAKEIEKDGINLGEMNLRLLKKVEELTLYLLQQQEEIENLKKEMKKIKN